MAAAMRPVTAVTVATSQCSRVTTDICHCLQQPPGVSESKQTAAATAVAMAADAAAAQCIDAAGPAADRRDEFLHNVQIGKFS